MEFFLSVFKQIILGNKYFLLLRDQNHGMTGVSIPEGAFSCIFAEKLVLENGRVATRGKTF
jgi:hypothetical protein